jgi:hypothetical protein
MNELQMNNCPYFKGCSRNFCPLDPDLHLRSGSNADRCRWMIEAKVSKVAGRVFTSGGRVMPDALLNLVPQSNLERLNEISYKRWKRLKSDS